MPTNKELEQRVKDLENMLAARGFSARPTELPEDEKERSDYIEFGSERHAVLLGVMLVDDVGQAEAAGDYVFTSPKTGQAYRLEDQITAFMSYPDPAQVAKLVLRQQVSVLEAGPPPIPEDAPALWNPDEF